MNGSQSDKDERMKAAQFVMKLKVPEQLSLKKRLPFEAWTFYSVFNHNIVIARNEVGLSVSGPMCFEFLVPSPTFLWRMIFLQWVNWPEHRIFQVSSTLNQSLSVVVARKGIGWINYFKANFLLILILFPAFFCCSQFDMHDCNNLWDPLGRFVVHYLSSEWLDAGFACHFKFHSGCAGGSTIKWSNFDAIYKYIKCSVMCNSFTK